ncbi:hypothetical protein Dimus_015795 [Dionaea muscipula]
MIDDAEEDADMTIPIKSHLKRMNSVVHGPMGAKRRKLEMLALPQKELPHQEELPKMKSTNSKVSKSASLSSQHDEEEPAINVDKGKAPVEVNPSCPTAVPETAAKTSSTTPLPPTDVKLSRIILDSINQSVE